MSNYTYVTSSYVLSFCLMANGIKCVVDSCVVSTFLFSEENELHSY